MALRVTVSTVLQVAVRDDRDRELLRNPDRQPDCYGYG